MKLDEAKKLIDALAGKKFGQVLKQEQRQEWTTIRNNIRSKFIQHKFRF